MHKFSWLNSREMHQFNKRVNNITLKWKYIAPAVNVCPAQRRNREQGHDL